MRPEDADRMAKSEDADQTTPSLLQHCFPRLASQKIFEPPHDKTNKMTVPKKNEPQHEKKYKMACTPSED